MSRSAEREKQARVEAEERLRDANTELDELRVKLGSLEALLRDKSPVSGNDMPLHVVSAADRRVRGCWGATPCRVGDEVFALVLVSNAAAVAPFAANVEEGPRALGVAEVRRTLTFFSLQPSRQLLLWRRLLATRAQATWMTRSRASWSSSSRWSPR